MKVTIRLIDLEELVPELTPAIRSLGDDVPMFLDIEGTPTIETEREKRMREEYPEYWMGLTMIEWRIWTLFAEYRDVSRKEIRGVMRGRQTHIDEDANYTFSNVVDVHIKNLRQKLYWLGNNHHILTRRGWGYQLQDGPAPQEFTAGYQFNVFEVKESKKATDENGALKNYGWKKNPLRLSAVEFTYLKEMKMDDIPKEEAGRRMHLYGSALDRAWNSASFAEYEEFFQPLYKHK